MLFELIFRSFLRRVSIIFCARRILNTPSPPRNSDGGLLVLLKLHQSDVQVLSGAGKRCFEPRCELADVVVCLSMGKLDWA